MKKIIACAAAAALIMSSAAQAGSDPIVQPVQVGAETVRYQQGVATLDLQGPHGAVQITPLELDHGGLSFGIAVLNTGPAPANIDVTNIDAHSGLQSIQVFTKDELEKKAKNRAMWAAIAVGLAGGLAAAAAANQRDYYNTTLITPRGTYRAFSSGPSAAGQIESIALAAGTGATLAQIQNRLDDTRRALGNEIVQLTTIDPGDSYAGRIVLAKIKGGKLPQRVGVTIHWNGDDYSFEFQMAKKGTRAPEFKALTPAPPVLEPAPTAPAT